MTNNRIGINETILLSMISIASTAATLVTSALPQIRNFYHLSPSQVAYVVSIFLLGYMLGQIIYGPLSNILGRLRALRIGLTINLAGVVCCIISPKLGSYSLLLLGRFISALGGSAGLVSTFIIVNESYSPAAARYLLSFAIVSFTGGIYLGTYLGGVFTYYFGWPSVFLLLVAHGGLMLLLSYKLPTDPQTDPSTINFKQLLADYLKSFTSAKLVIFSLILASSTVIAYLYAAQVPLIAEAAPLSLSAKSYGSWNMLNALGSLSSGAISARLTKQLKGTTVITIGLCCALLAILCLLITDYFAIHQPIILFVATTVLFFASGIVYPSASFYASTAIACKANASSAMNFINMAVAMFVVTAVGYLPCSHFYSFIIGLSGYIGFTFLLLVIQGLRCE